MALARLKKFVRGVFTGSAAKKESGSLTYLDGRSPLPRDVRVDWAKRLVKAAWSRDHLSVPDVRELEIAIKDLELSQKEIRNEVIPSMPAGGMGLAAQRITRVKTMLERL